MRTQVRRGVGSDQFSHQVKLNARALLFTLQEKRLANTLTGWYLLKYRCSRIKVQFCSKSARTSAGGTRARHLLRWTTEYSTLANRFYRLRQPASDGDQKMCCTLVLGIRRTRTPREPTAATTVTLCFLVCRPPRCLYGCPLSRQESF